MVGKLVPFWNVYCTDESNKSEIRISLVPAFKNFQAGFR